MSDPDGAMGAGPSDATDLETPVGGDATGGGNPGDPDDMGADDRRTVDEGAGRPTIHESTDEGEHDEHAG